MQRLFTTSTRAMLVSWERGGAKQKTWKDLVVGIDADGMRVTGELVKPLTRFRTCRARGARVVFSGVWKTVGT